MVDVTTFTKSDERHMTVVNDPLARLTTTNQGHFRIHIHFLKTYETLPGFGIFLLEKHEFRDMTYREVLEHCRELPVANEQYQSLQKRGAAKDEIIQFEFVFMTNPTRLTTRARVMSADRQFSKWTELWETKAPCLTRFCFEIPTCDCQVWDTKTFDCWFLGIDRISTRKSYHCVVCLEEHPISDFTFYQCGHGMCTSVHRESFRSNKVEEHCFVCKQLKGIPCRVRNRVSTCPIDSCPQKGNDYFFSPCGCLITHTFVTNEEKDTFVGQRCPYRYCQRKIDRVQMCFL